MVPFTSIIAGFPQQLRKLENSISSYSVRMRENTDQKHSEYGHFSPSDGEIYQQVSF